MAEDCLKCIHATVKRNKYPCNECTQVVNGDYVGSKDHFVEAQEPGYCTTCRYLFLSAQEAPCSSCSVICNGGESAFIQGTKQNKFIDDLARICRKHNCEISAENITCGTEEPLLVIAVKFKDLPDDEDLMIYDSFDGAQK